MILTILPNYLISIKYLTIMYLWIPSKLDIKNLYYNFELSGNRIAIDQSSLWEWISLWDFYIFH